MFLAGAQQLYLKLINYNSPLLAVHLEWFLKSGSQPPISYKMNLDGDVEMDMQDNLEAKKAKPVLTSWIIDTT